ncbi:carboxypeptidase-like regulatory domain-containing protein, partial [candidate division KSB1 bacterium]|nr:carboxypeptidase-like regulatory domain-containing protein [candidate division KSB1 bacterium]
MFSSFNFLLRNLRLPASVAAVLLISLTVAGTGLAQIEFGTISGTVIDEGTGRPLTGTNIIVVDTRLGASTDRDGNFEILRVPPGSYSLEISFIGYAKQNVDVSVSANRTAIVNIEMETDILNLDEIIVTGAGEEVRKKELATTIQTISAQEIAAVPVESIEHLLAGRLAGGSVRIKTGQPGTGASISLRGITSSRADQTPQIYIDGVRMEIAQGQGSGLGGVSPSSLSDIHIDDIDHIEIVKPGAGTTLYGSEAASGIIQIFTKKGRAGAPRWNIMVEQGWDQPITRFLYDKGLELEDGTFTYENLMRDHVLQDGHYEKYSLNVSGGNEALTYNISGAVKDAQGIMRNNASTYYSFNTGIRTFVSEKLQIDVTARASRDRIQRNQSNNSIPGIMVALEVLDWPFSRPDSNVPLQDKIDRLNIYFLQENINTTYRYNFSQTATYDYNEYWSNKFTLGIDYRKSEQRLFTPLGTDLITTTGINRQDRENMTFTFDYRATIKYPIFDFLSNAFSSVEEGDITSNFTVGGRGFRRNARFIFGDGQELGLPGTDDFDNAAIISAGEGNSEIFNGTILFSEQIGLWDKLFLTGSFTIDGNTSFGTQGESNAIETVNYSSGSLAYNISDENFWESIPFA